MSGTALPALVLYMKRQMREKNKDKSRGKKQRLKARMGGEEEKGIYYTITYYVQSLQQLATLLSPTQYLYGKTCRYARK